MLLKQPMCYYSSYAWMGFLLHTCTLTEVVKLAKQLQVSTDHSSLKIIYDAIHARSP